MIPTLLTVAMVNRGPDANSSSAMVFPADPPAAERASENGEPFHDDENSNRFVNFYKCEDCGHEWEDEWSCTCEDDCPECGARHMMPCKSEDAA